MSDTTRIRVHDLLFEKSIDFQEIDSAIDRIATQMNKDLPDKNPLFLSILNGAFMFSADRSELTKIPTGA